MPSYIIEGEPIEAANMQVALCKWLINARPGVGYTIGYESDTTLEADLTDGTVVLVEVAE